MGSTTAHHAEEAPDKVFNDSFAAEDRKELLAEDAEAWEGVTGLLLLIVTVGVLFFAAVVCVIAL